VDWNDDGYTDLIVGDRNGYINYFQRNSNGTLQAGSQLLSGGVLLDAGANSAPDFEDFDLDGDLDMIVGTDGTAPVRYYENTGSASAYQFDGYVNFIAGGSTVTLYRSMPSIYDMNGDGLFDVVMGAQTRNFHYFENTGTPGNPVFAADVTLQYEAGGAVSTPTYDSRMDICDWNEDGYIDIVAGDYDPYVYLYFAYNGVGVEERSTGIVIPASISIAGNPVVGPLAVNVNLGQTSTPEFTVFTMDGRQVLSHVSDPLSPGHNRVIIPADLPVGAYVLRCITETRVLTEKFVVLE
jgi:hypothetical protein